VRYGFKKVVTKVVFKGVVLRGVMCVQGMVMVVFRDVGMGCCG
jgi:hypothetical protein